MMSDCVYGVLLVSFSRHSHQHSFMPPFMDHPRIRIIGVADDPDIEGYLKPLNQAWADDLGVPYFEPVEAAIHRPDVDIVSIGHEIERRSGIAIMAAKAGKHLWIDKFIGANLTECNAVVEAVQQAEVKSIIPSYAYNDLTRQSQDALRSRMLGELMGIHVEVMFNKGMPDLSPDEIGKSPFLPPGRWKFPDVKRELLTVGAYAVALITGCFGRIKEVYGQGDAYFFKAHAQRGAEDFGTLTLVDEQGRIGTLSAGRIGVGTHGAGGPQQAYLFGTEGTACIDGTRPRFDTYIRSSILGANYDPASDDPMQWASSSPSYASGLSDSPMHLALEDFIRALDEDGQPRFTVQDARDHMEILLAGYQAILKNKPISLPLPVEETA